MVRPSKFYGTFLVSAIILWGCGDDTSKTVSNPNAARGRGVYLANCVACHNNDPARDGPIGPAIKGSPKELLEARVLSTSYPPNYRPKRATKIMPQFPFLKDEIPYLAAYLAQ
jgi:mono/diheme cytochrome c family protein